MLKGLILDLDGFFGMILNQLEIWQRFLIKFVVSGSILC